MHRVLIAVCVAAGMAVGPPKSLFAAERPGPGNGDGSGGHHSAAPGNSENAPGHNGLGPGNGANASARDTPGQDNSANAPGQHPTGPADNPRGPRQSTLRSTAAADSRGSELSLPPVLRPVNPCRPPGGGCTTSLFRDGPSEVAVEAIAPGLPLAGSPASALACREGIVKAALPYKATRVDAFSVGEAQSTAAGQVVPLFVRIVYPTATGYEVRQATVNCRLDARGVAVALS